MPNIELKAPQAAGIVHKAPDPGYSLPADPASRESLERWQDHKFGVIIHWGLYAAFGKDGSWTLCRSNDEESMLLPPEWEGNEDGYYQHYMASRTSFTGENYDPQEWATLCSAAGMKYLVFTTKHHDGFALYDTQLSTFKVTAPDVPLRKDVLRETFSAFRSEGLETGAYFSKADWAHPDYWAPELPITDRFSNYDPSSDTDRWSRFRSFTHGQIREILTDYGDINVLWLDAGWVQAPHEDLQISELAAMARQLQPGILVVDREVHGPNEDYRTPEQQFPDHSLDYPWESCITLTPGWCSMKPDEESRSAQEIISMLVRIVARGGNLLLGIGPDATGALAPSIRETLEDVGRWLETNGAAIYGTRTVPAGLVPQAASESVKDSNRRIWWLTQSTGLLNLLHLEPMEGFGEEVFLTVNAEVTAIELLGHGQIKAWAQDENGNLRFNLPEVNESKGIAVQVSYKLD